MIILKRDGTVYFCESCCNAFAPFTSNDFTKYEENRHIIRSADQPRRLIMIDSTLRVADLVRYSDVFPAKLTPKSLLKQTYPLIVSALGPYGFLDDDGGSPFDVAFAKDGKCYVLRGGGAVDEVEEFFPMSHAKEAAMAEYMRSKDEPTYSLVQRIYKAIENTSLKVQFPVVVMNTKNNEVKVISREEAI